MADVFLLNLSVFVKYSFSGAAALGPSHACLAKPSKIGYNKSPQTDDS